MRTGPQDRAAAEAPGPGRTGLGGTVLSWFAPLQPVLAVAGLLLLAFALRSRLRAQRSCRGGATA